MKEEKWQRRDKKKRNGSKMGVTGRSNFLIAEQKVKRAQKIRQERKEKQDQEGK